MKNTSSNYLIDGDSAGYSSPSKPVQSKFEYDLFDESKNKEGAIIRVKCFNVLTKRERWSIMENDLEVLKIEASKISKKEQVFLRSQVGFSFMIEQFKNGIRNLSKFKLELKKKIKEMNKK
jgi:hypothetical protein